VGDSKLEGVGDMLEDRAAVQRHLGKLDSWPERNLMSFNYEKYESFSLRKKIPVHCYGLVSLQRRA